MVYQIHRYHTFYGFTHGKGITNRRIRTGTNWNVAGNCAQSSNSAGTVARIDALVSQTSLVIWAVVVGQTFGIASDVGIASMVRQTFANVLVETFFAVGVYTARRGTARMRCRRLYFRFCKKTGPRYLNPFQLI